MRARQVGGCLPVNRSEGLVDNRRGTGTHKCARDESSTLGITDPIEGKVQFACPPENRQSSSSGLHQQDGEPPIEATDRGDKRALELLSEPGDIHISGTPPRDSEQSSRQLVKGEARIKRLEVGPSDIPESDSQMGTMPSGSLCQSTECTTEQIHKLETRPNSSRDRCISDVMEGSSELCLPSVLHDSKMLSETQTGKRRNDTDNTGVGNATMVPEHLGVTVQRPNTPPNVGETASIPIGNTPSVAGEQQPAASSMEIIRGQMQAPGISRQTAELLEKSRQAGTRSAYGSSWQKWSCWCVLRGKQILFMPLWI